MYVCIVQFAIHRSTFKLKIYTSVHLNYFTESHKILEEPMMDSLITVLVHRYHLILLHYLVTLLLICDSHD